MTINITPEIDAAYGAFLDEQIDAFMDGVAIRRRDTHPYARAEVSGLIDFAAGYQAARAALSSPVAAQPADSAMEVLRELVEAHDAQYGDEWPFAVKTRMRKAFDRARALTRQGDTA
jgi:hypothetical protein